MLTINIDESEVKKLCRERVEEIVKEVDAEYIFWDSTELKKRTCMSWNTIQDNFFFDPRFQKAKIGGKWYFPVQETRSFLKSWLLEQANEGGKK
ncbi:group-specific protein [Paenibacillus sp. FSL R5-808]|uniref:group-specific protein n=1 Tax=unclassified Paenibacillus TaxID=185978 RepID=UPI00056975EC|nr:group-specific protein [Paenibacillus sp. FSL R5-808]